MKTRLWSLRRALAKPVWLGSYAALFAIKVFLKLGWIDRGSYGRIVLLLLRWNSLAAGRVLALDASSTWRKSSNQY